MTPKYGVLLTQNVLGSSLVTFSILPNYVLLYHLAKFNGITINPSKTALKKLTGLTSLEVKAIVDRCLNLSLRGRTLIVPAVLMLGSRSNTCYPDHFELDDIKEYTDSGQLVKNGRKASRNFKKNKVA